MSAGKAFAKFFATFTDSAWEDVTVADAFAAGFKAGERGARAECADLKRRIRWARDIEKSLVHRERNGYHAELMDYLDLRKPLPRKRVLR